MSWRLPWDKSAPRSTRYDRKVAVFVVLAILFAGSTVGVFRHELMAVAVRLTPSITSWWSESISHIAKLIEDSENAALRHLPESLAKWFGLSVNRPLGSAFPTHPRGGKDSAHPGGGGGEDIHAQVSDPFIAAAEERRRQKDRSTQQAGSQRQDRSRPAFSIYSREDSTGFVYQFSPREKGSALSAGPTQNADAASTDGIQNAGPKRRRTGAGFDGQPQPGEEDASIVLNESAKTSLKALSPPVHASVPAPPPTPPTPPPPPAAPPPPPGSPPPPPGLQLSAPVSGGMQWLPIMHAIVGLGTEIPEGHPCSLDNVYYQNMVTNPDGSAKTEHTTPPVPASCLNGNGACFQAEKMTQTCR